MTKQSLYRWSMAALVLSAIMPVTAASQTLDQIRSEGEISIGFVGSAAPFSTATPDDKPEGYAIELCDHVVGHLKNTLDNSGLKTVYTETTVEDGLTMVANGNIDLLCGPVSDTLTRRENVSFSLPIYLSGIGAIVKSDTATQLRRVLSGEAPHTGPVWRATINRGLVNHTYAVVEGTLAEQWARAAGNRLGVQLNIRTVDNHQEGVDLVENGGADAYFADRAILHTYTTSNDDLILLRRFFTYELIAIAVPRNDDDMRLEVDTALSEFYLSEEFEAFYTEYFGEPTETAMLLFRGMARRE